ncbi:dienelactone hydrolase family protein [Streptomyces canus]|uniref:dienelactone hydrolase family protein n=1 Tax=Streptomyces canus TaxID=58343 RepID=UPI00074A598E|nr:dienelactone hydrolase family protein [Streptomyces canus]KUN04315.1 dienelactone hydrolase [Streptomyces canus]
MVTVHSTMVDITMPDGTADAYLARPSDDNPHPGILYFMDAPGLRPSLKGYVDRLASAGYTVLAPNLFYRHGRSPVVEMPDVIDPIKYPKQFESLWPIMGSLTAALSMADADAYLRWLSGYAQAADGKVGTVGYCYGARVALRTAGTYPDRVAAVAGFHGGDLATEASDSPHLLAKRVTAEAYFGHADKDPMLPQEQIDRLEKAFSDAGVRHKAEVYPGASHGFTFPDTAYYHAAASERHWTPLLDLFARTLQGNTP